MFKTRKVLCLSKDWQIRVCHETNLQILQCNSGCCVEHNATMSKCVHFEQLCPCIKDATTIKPLQFKSDSSNTSEIKMTLTETYLMLRLTVRSVLNTESTCTHSQSWYTLFLFWRRRIWSAQIPSPLQKLKVQSLPSTQKFWVLIQTTKLVLNYEKGSGTVQDLKTYHFIS